MNGKRILVGVTGGIAAYKAVDLVRRLVEAGAEVQVVMTAGAKQFITPLTLQAVSGNPVRDDLWDRAAEAAMGHIELARWAEQVIIAPASASFLARLAHGYASDLLSTLCLATAAPLAVAPAMNRLMWSNAATQENVRILHGRGVQVIGPGDGSQACGEIGPGRMLESADIIAALGGEPSGPLAGVRVLVTAGPTREPLDPVRYISNRSSGKMGYAIAEAARAAGAEVVLVSGPVALPPPAGVERVAVETAAHMLEVVQSRVAGTDIFIGAAAVADWTPAHPAPEKLKKQDAAPEFTLTATTDILATVTAGERRPFAVGFAAETGDLRDRSATKLETKKLDMIAGNLVGAGRGFDADDNELLVLWPGGEQALGPAPKRGLAQSLVALIADRYRGKG